MLNFHAKNNRDKIHKKLHSACTHQGTEFTAGPMAHYSDPLKVKGLFTEPSSYMNTVSWCVHDTVLITLLPESFSVFCRKSLLM